MVHEGAMKLSPGRRRDPAPHLCGGWEREAYGACDMAGAEEEQEGALPAVLSSRVVSQMWSENMCVRYGAGSGALSLR